MKPHKVILNYLRLFKYDLRRSKREKPKVIQMPITSRCNSRCVTCNVWKHKSICDIDPIALNNAFRDPYFSEVTVVGINGGELTLVPNVIDIIKATFVLPNLQSLYVISNGLVPNKLFAVLKEVHLECSQRNISLHFSLSVDGYGKVHELVRGVPNCFVKTKKILDELKENYQEYCDSWNVGCTISKYNVAYLREMESFIEQYNVNVEYHLAVPNKRIGTFDDYNYSVLCDERSRIMAAEFFYTKYLEEGNTADGRRYYAMYHYLVRKGKDRLCGCSYLKRDVTIDENLNLLLCATASDVIGSLKEHTASYLMNLNNVKLEEQKISKHCDTCIHYAYHPMTLRGYRMFLRDYIRRMFIYRYYELKSRPMSWYTIKSILVLYKKALNKYWGLLFNYCYL